MFPSSDGWQESSVKLCLPKTFAKCASEDDVHQVEISGILHQDLLQSIISAFKNLSFEAFNLKGFTQFWKPLCGEIYTSEKFREMEWIQSMRAPGDTLESIVVPIMAYSDMTHLANFSTVAFWPIYFFNGLTSKYI